MTNEAKREMMVAGVILLGLALFVFALFASYKLNEKQPTKIEHSINWTETGEKAGKNLGRTTRGFFKGLRNSGDGK